MTEKHRQRLSVTLADKVGLVTRPCRVCGKGFLTSRYNPFEDCPACAAELSQDSVGPVVRAEAR